MYAYYALSKWGWEPSKFANLPRKEKFLVIAMIDDIIKQEKKVQSKAKRKR